MSTDRCPCGALLDPTSWHDDTPDGRQLCPDCCPTCRPVPNGTNTEPRKEPRTA